MLIDSHCHLSHMPKAVGGVAAICEQAASANVHGMLTIATTPDALAAMQGDCAEQSYVWCAAGLHPEVVNAQRDSFALHLELARRFDLPVIVHTRNAVEDTLELIRAHPGYRGVIHCFTEDQRAADAFIAVDFLLSFSGILTFRNADALRRVAADIDAQMLLVETDPPYLAPVPMRGKSNQAGLGCAHRGLSGRCARRVARADRAHDKCKFRTAVPGRRAANLAVAVMRSSSSEP